MTMQLSHFRAAPAVCVNLCFLLGMPWLLASCGAALPRPTAAQLAVARRSEPAVTLSDLERGRSVYAAKCSGCHALQHPDGLSPPEWQPMVSRMQKEQGVKLIYNEERDMLRYLVSSSELAVR